MSETASHRSGTLLCLTIDPELEMWAAMSFFARFGPSKDRLKIAALEERIRVMSDALAGRQVNARTNSLRPWFTAIIAGTFFVLGAVLGIYFGPLKQASFDVLMNLGLGPPRTDVDAADAAHQKGDTATAVRLLLPLAQRGEIRAQALLGHLYYHERGDRQDDLEAIKWFRAAAEQGDERSQFHLGLMYAGGQGVPQDHDQAAKWYRLAADQGNAQASYNLGLAYAKGEGVLQDNMTAHMYFNLAASRFPAADSQNRSLAVRNRDLVASKMTPAEVVQAQARAREWKPK